MIARFPIGEARKLSLIPCGEVLNAEWDNQVFSRVANRLIVSPSTVVMAQSLPNFDPLFGPRDQLKTFIGSATDLSLLSKSVIQTQTD